MPKHPTRGQTDTHGKATHDQKACPDSALRTRPQVVHRGRTPDPGNRRKRKEERRGAGREVKGVVNSIGGSHN
eukprot:scaffold95369_cov25-Tisochrysis_lutea.AAC.1